MPLYYADASALVKLVREESESRVLRSFAGGSELVSSELVLSEVPRAVTRAATLHPELPLGDLRAKVADVLDAIALLPVDRPVLLAAGAFTEPALRTLDAIHVASAVQLDVVAGFITYDERQAAVARAAGLTVIAPGTSGS